MQYDRGLVWLRRDLRLQDNAALAAALSQCRRVYCAFIFDRTILDQLLVEGISADRRVDFIHRSIIALDNTLRQHNAALIVRHAVAADAIVQLADELGVHAVFANADYEPYATQRDNTVKQALLQRHRDLLLFKDHVIFERDEILSNAGTPFSVFTAYKSSWLKRISAGDVAEQDCSTNANRLASAPSDGIPTLQQLGFESYQPRRFASARR